MESNPGLYIDASITLTNVQGGEYGDDIRPGIQLYKEQLTAR